MDPRPGASKSPGGEGLPLRVLLVDDHSILRSGVGALLTAEPGLRVVGGAASGEEGEAMALDLCPDLVLMDLSMPGCGGIEATHRIRAAADAPPVLILTMAREEDALLDATDAGATGFLRKECSDRELLAAVREVAAGRTAFGPVAARLLVQHYRSGRAPRTESDRLELLSERERQVFVRVAAGCTSSQIGEELRISPKTVDTYRSRVQEKLGLHHRSDLVRLAMRHRLLSRAA